MRSDTLLINSILAEHCAPFRVVKKTVVKSYGEEEQFLLDDGSNICPSLSIDQFGGMSESEIAEALMRIYSEQNDKDSAVEKVFDIFGDKDALLQNVKLRLLNGSTKANNILRGAVRSKFLDMELTYVVDVEVGGRSGSVTVTQSHIDRLGITAEELDAAAKANSEKDIHIESMLDALFGLGFQGELPPAEQNMTVISNNSKSYGAGGLATSEGARAIYAKTALGRDIDGVYVIPSSIHEVIAFTCDDGKLVEKLRETVRSVNRTQVEPDEVLSDEVYFVSKDGVVSIA